MAAVWLLVQLYVPADQLAAPSDFQNYWKGARAIGEHRSPFLDRHFDFPPVLAAIFLPLGRMDYADARLVWNVLSALCVGFALWRTARANGSWMWATVAFAANGAVPETVALGQVTPLLMALFLLSLSGRGAVFAAGANAAVKLFPLGLWLAWLPDWRGNWRADWRAGAPLVAWFVGLELAAVWLISAFAPPPYWPIGSGIWMGSPAMLNWSLPGWILRAMDAPTGLGPLPQNWMAGQNPGAVLLSSTEVAASLGSAVVVMLGGWWYLRRLSVRRSAAVLALMPLILVAAPLSWTHYQLLNAPVVAMLAARSGRPWRAIGLGLLLYRVPVEWARWYVGQHGLAVADPWFWWVVPAIAPLAGLALFVWAARVGAEPRDGRESSPIAEPASA